MKKKIILGIILFAAGFVLLFLFRLFYGFYSHPASTNNDLPDLTQVSSLDFTTRNYASKKFSNKQTLPQTVTVDQKYEKIATLKSLTDAFKDDEGKIREEVANNDALIQFEQKSGTVGNQVLILAIGVPPSNFDTMVHTLKTIGEVKSIQIDKKDKTNEYKELKANLTSLEKIRNSLIELKQKEGKIAELIQLENRILEIESQIQDLGVDLGVYDEENEFCTVLITLAEKRTVPGISVFQRLKTAFEWALPVYFLFVLILFLGGVTTLILLIILEKLKWLPPVVKDKLNS